MQLTIGRIVSLVIAFIYAGLVLGLGGIGYWKWPLTLLLPLALIWFPEEIGSLTGYYKTGYVNVQTPAAIIAFLGWSMLVGLPVFLFFFVKFR